MPFCKDTLQLGIPFSSAYLTLVRSHLGYATQVWTPPSTISTQSSSAHVEERDQELWGTLEQDCLLLVLAKNNKSVSDWSIQVCTRAVAHAACLECELVFRLKC